MDQSSQVSVLDEVGARGDVRTELLRYDERRFAPTASPTSGAPSAGTLPLADEAFVECWRGWVGEAQQDRAFDVLSRALPQLRFPIRAGISTTSAYRAATLQGTATDDLPEATGLALARPEQVELVLFASKAGHVPILVARHRPDFVALTQALAKRNEPVEIPEGQGAAMISGYANWTRIHAHRSAWQATPATQRKDATWAEAFSRLRQEPARFRDRLIVLSDGPYSGVAAEDVGLPENRWRALSLVIRREHECTHYLTHRLFGSARNHLLDELLADHAGLVAATGRFNATWFLRFLGLHATASDTGSSRLALYRGDPPLSDAAFALLPPIVRRVAENVERFDHGLPAGPRGPEMDVATTRALASFSLLALATANAPDRLAQALG